MKTRKRNKRYNIHKKTKKGGYLGIFSKYNIKDSLFTTKTKINTFDCTVMFTLHVFKHLDSFKDFNIVEHDYDTDNTMVHGSSTENCPLSFITFITNKLNNMQLTMHDFQHASQYKNTANARIYTFSKQIDINEQADEYLTIVYTTTSGGNMPDTQTVNNIPAYQFKLVSIYPTSSSIDEFGKKNNDGSLIWTTERNPIFLQKLHEQIEKESNLAKLAHEKQSMSRNELNDKIKQLEQENEDIIVLGEKALQENKQTKLAMENEKYNSWINNITINSTMTQAINNLTNKNVCNSLKLNNLNNLVQELKFVYKYLNLDPANINNIDSCVKYNKFVKDNKKIIKNTNTNKIMEGSPPSPPSTGLTGSVLQSQIDNIDV